MVNQFLFLMMVRRWVKQESRRRRGLEAMSSLLAVVFALLLQYSSYLTVFESFILNLVEQTSRPAFLVTIATVLSSIFVWRKKIRAPAYVLTCATGFLFVGWILDGVVPLIDCWVDDAIDQMDSSDCG